jgi:hypothetical protein
MPTFPTSPQPLNAYTFGWQQKVLVSTSEDGTEQRRAIWPDGKRYYKLQYQLLNQSEMQILFDFFKTTCSGSLNSFTFHDNVENENVTCRFGDPGLEFQRIRYQYYNVQINITQVFE